MKYSQKTDQKWQKKWADTSLYKFDENSLDKKLYLLEMFSYPSGSNLHIGHWWNYSLPDSWSRMKRMQGFNIFHPVGFDAFGLPAENYAIKTGVHPMDSTNKNIKTMEQQFHTLGSTYDWDYEVKTCVPEYYKWTQWLFLKLYEKNLAYRKEAPVNWCPECKTVLANEQAAGGVCERCGSQVLHKNMTQWFFKITAYAEELLEGLKNLDWPEKTKKIQENWIGKSEGVKFSFTVVNSNRKIDVFTTRIDTIMGVSYIVLAPEHPIIDEITTAGYRKAVDKYKEFAAKQTEIERLSTVKEKSGVFTGSYVYHPFTGEKIPIWISDYVIASYGTGAVMAVPAHDERDYIFAHKFSLPIIQVIQQKEASFSELPLIDDGILINSGEFNGLTSIDARIKIASKLEAMGLGVIISNYRLRDWLVSRQRYWGAPIPIVYCEHCGIVPVPESDLPVMLPYNVEFKPTGESPLASCSEFVYTTCPKCGSVAKRETDTLDTFVCSSWYYLRFFDSNNLNAPFDFKKVNQIMPVDKYVGGVEHAAMHLLYARFITKALHDMGYLNFNEPFKFLVHQGTILASDGQKMSKSKGNAVSPDNYVSAYGSDVFRMYLAFGFSYTDGGPWSDEGLKAVARFISKIERIIDSFIKLSKVDKSSCTFNTDDNLDYARHYAIKQVTDDIESFKFNTAIARIMEFANALTNYQQSHNRYTTFESDVVSDLLIIMSPFAPHFCEEMWEVLGHEYSIFNQKWPTYDEKKLTKNTVEMAVQVNGKVRGCIFISAHTDEEKIKKTALDNEKINAYIQNRQIRKIIIIKNRIINIVCD